MADGVSHEDIREGLQKLAGLAIAIEVAEHSKTAASIKFLEKLRKALPKLKPSKAKLLSQAQGKNRALTSELSQMKREVASAMDELASAERLARGATYGAAVAIPAAGIGGLMYGKKKGREEGKEAFIRELLGA